MLKKMVYLMNSMQVKSGSELVFPMLFDHMSFATHRCWEVNLKMPYARTLAAWEQHYKGSLKALHDTSDTAMRIGFLLPSAQIGKARQLPSGWLMQRRERSEDESANAQANLE